ncbi:hypothetical protein [Pseudomonas ovata]|uniref:hypothetical protein n=1 Tax=Pseudomonas ovata TaxID=1839709 RepID=UPI00126033CB|nr:hypothetical protein [Pseudomonas ovata]
MKVEVKYRIEVQGAAMPFNVSSSSPISLPTARSRTPRVDTTPVRADKPKPVFTPAHATVPGAVSTTPSQAAPVQAYALADWLKGYGRDLSNEVALGQAATYRDPANVGFDNASPEEQAEFAQLTQKHLHQLYEDNGLLEVGTRFKALACVPGLNERLHQAFNASVSSDSRMMALMGKAGIETA